MELLIVLLIGNIITNVNFLNIECNSNYVNDESEGDVGIIYLCEYAKRMEHSKEGVLERLNTSNTQSNRQPQKTMDVYRRPLALRKSRATYTISK